MKVGNIQKHGQMYELEGFVQNASVGLFFYLIFKFPKNFTLLEKRTRIFILDVVATVIVTMESYFYCYSI